MNTIPPSSSYMPFPGIVATNDQRREPAEAAGPAQGREIKSSRSLANLRSAGNSAKNRLLSNFRKPKEPEQRFAASYVALDALRTSQANSYISTRYIDTASEALRNAASAKIFPSDVRELAVRMQVNLDAGILPLVRVISQATQSLDDQIAVLRYKLENECRELSNLQPRVRPLPGGLPNAPLPLTREEPIDADSTQEKMRELLSLQATHAVLIGDIDKIRTMRQSPVEATKKASRSNNLVTQINNNKEQLKALVALAEEC